MENKNPPKNNLKARCRAAGLPYMLVYLRIRKLGWTEERALNTPKQPFGSPGHRKGPETLKAKAERAGLKYTTVYNRVKRGWNEAEALSKAKEWWKEPVS